MPDGLLVVYGSQNGTAQDYAETVYLEAMAKGSFQVRLLTLNEYKRVMDMGQAEERLLVIIISNTGDGDPPDNASDYWHWIRERGTATSPPSPLYEGVKIALLGLGDSEYESFNNTGRTLERLLPSLGASWLVTPTFADAQKGGEETAQTWMGQLREALAAPSRADPLPELPDDPSPPSSSSSPADNGDMTRSEAAADASPASGGPSTVACHLWRLPFPEQIPEVQTDSLPVPHPTTMQVEYLPPSASAESHVSPSPVGRPACHMSPIQAQDVSFSLLTAPDAIKPVWSVTFTIPTKERQSRWTCEAGDAFGLVCENDPAAVDLLLSLLGLEGHSLVCVTSLIVPPQEGSLASHIHQRPLRLRDLFLKHVDIMHFPKKSLLRSLADHCRSPLQRNYLLHLCTKAGSSQYMSLASGHASVLDFLYSFDTCRPSLECLLSHLPLLHPRFYSVCSATGSPTVEFVYSPMQFALPDGQMRTGVSTAWLDQCRQRAITQGTSNLSLALFPRPSPHFRLPLDGDLPVIMICAGTGVAPFVGFLRSLPGPRPGMTWLFYGFRHEKQDFLFRADLDRLRQAGILSRLTITTSRQEESGHPHHVQDALRLHSQEIYQLLTRTESPAVAYICGDELTMVKSVNAALLDMIMEHGGQPAREANATLAAWNAGGRVVRDIWI